MAIRFAVASGDYSNPAIWDNGAVPLSGDDVYANGFTIVVNQDVTLNTLGNSDSQVIVPNIATPAMTSNISPTGIITSSPWLTNQEGYRAFDQNGFSFFRSSTTNTAFLQYQFPSSKIIKRYAIRGSGFSSVGNPRVFTFEASNDGVSWTILDTQTTVTMIAGGVFNTAVANTTAYLYYKLNVTATQTAGQNITIAELQMTESTGTVFGGNIGGIFNHTSGGFTVNANNLSAGTSDLITYNHATGINTLNVTNDFTPVNITGAITITSGDVNISIPQFSVIRSVAGTVSGGLIKNGSGILNFIGNVINLSNVNSSNVFQLNAGTVNITGNVNGSGNTNGSNHGIIIAGANTTVTGNVTSGGGSSASHGVVISSGVLAVIGNISVNIGTGSNNGINQTGGNLTIIGSISGGFFSNQAGVVSSTAGSITVNGVITASGGIGLSSSNIAATVQISGPLVNVNGVSALYAAKYFITVPSTTITTQSSVGVNNVFYNNTSILDALLASNVRNGISFGLGSLLTGTLKVPLPSQVSVGVETDNTVGTAVLTAEDFLNEISTSNNLLAVRLRNVATVETTGDQIASI